MPIEAKPLFRPDVLRAHVRAFCLPPLVDSFRPKLARWAEMIASGRAAALNEQEILPEFLSDFFIELLGYTHPAGGKRYTLSRERHVEVDGKVADAVLGEFGGGADKVVVALEGKGAKDPLDRPFGGRRMSAVDQGYRYAINLKCDWILLTSIRQVRLYHKGSDQHSYERFDVEELAASEELLKRFVFLLGADRVVPVAGRCHFYELLAESEQVGRELTNEFYFRYSDMRQDIFRTLCRDNPDAPRHNVLTAAQKLLDRVLFCAFCEDRGLLPPETLRKAYEHRDPYHPRPVWENFRGLFAAVNRGNAALGIHGYNGGLFADDATLDSLKVADEACAYFRDLGEYDYRPPHQAAEYAPTAGNSSLIDVDILGHIFEQSITDLERIRNELEGGEEAAEPRVSRRKRDGAVYTPSFITRYIVQEALGGVLGDRFEALRAERAGAAKGAGRAALADPRVYELDKLKKTERTALVDFYEAWQDRLQEIRLLDPACGSGAFLIEAFDQMHAAYQASNDRLEELRGYRTLFDLDKRILENNLYGVDLNEEAVEICRLSLWIKTAERGKPLTSLDHTIRVGNSIVSDPAIHPKAFDWQAAFPEVFRQGGFDVVVANPPYVRQELFSELKPYLEAHYRTYHGMADLYVYFYELALRMLKPGGLMSLIVTNKWMKSGYGEPLRRHLAEECWIESVVDFGHAKQIFTEADVFPSIIVARRPTEAPKPATARLCTIPREQLRIDDLSRQIQQEGVELPLTQLRADAWQLEAGGVNALMAKIKANGVPLAEYAGAKPYRGILTGFNEAFLIDSAMRDALVKEDPNCTAIIRPYLRGQDVERWCADWAGLWMIAIKSSADHGWPWSDQGEDAEQTFATTYPSVYRHLKAFEPSLRKRQDKGRFWWELRSCAYWDRFEAPKLFYQEIQFHPGFAFDATGLLANNKTFILPVADYYLLAILNSPVMWWHNWRYLPHMKDEALSPVAFQMEALPVPVPSASIRKETDAAVARLIAIAQTQQTTRRDILDWLRVQHEVEKPTLRLQGVLSLDSDALLDEVKKVRGKKRPLSAAAVKNLREEYVRTIEPARALAAEALALETRVSDLVNAAYGLTPEEIALMWQTAPPRMPLPTP